MASFSKVQVQYTGKWTNRVVSQIIPFCKRHWWVFYKTDHTKDRIVTARAFGVVLMGWDYPCVVGSTYVYHTILYHRTWVGTGVPFWLTRAICQRARKALASLAATPVYRSSPSLCGKATEYFWKAQQSFSIVHIAHCVKRSECPNLTQWKQANII